MNVDRLERLLRLVARTEDEELSCTGCFELLPQYADLEVAGADPDARIPHSRQHLVQCVVCREEYETLRELARLDRRGRMHGSDGAAKFPAGQLQEGQHAGGAAGLHSWPRHALRRSGHPARGPIPRV